MAEISIHQVLDDTNLLQAWYKVKSNKGCGGVDGVSIGEFEHNLLSRLALLRDEVHYRTYLPKPLLRVQIPKKSGGMRPLSIPTVRDRILQSAVALIVEPIFEAEFESCSYAYRRGRSIQQAVSQIEMLRDSGFVWVADIDIASYFNEIDHDNLMSEVAKLIHDTEILHLITIWLQAEVLEGKKRFRLTRGVPQGSPLSPQLANLYLDKLDEAMLGKNFKIIRYSDDFIILCKSKKRAAKALEFTAEVLDSLKLRIKKEKSRLVDFNQGFTFLGVDFIRSLTLKTQYPEVTPTIINCSTLADIPGKLKVKGSPGILSKELQPRSTMGLAFAEAGIDKDDFPDIPEPVMEIGTTESQESISTASDHDPLLRTLYLFSHGTVLGKESERFVIKKKGEIVNRVPAIKVDQIMVFGNSQITTQAMHFCIEEKIPIFLLSGKGKFYGIVDGFDSDPVLLHRDQFNRADSDEFCLSIARGFIRGKITNCRIILQRQKRRQQVPGIVDCIAALKNIGQKIAYAKSLNQLRGYEGAAARCYFQAIGRCIDPDWGFLRRTRQPPRDPINSMLSYGYTLLFYNIYSLLRSRRLNPHVGFLHPIRPGHPALVSDMMEEFRAPVVDAVVLNLAGNRRLTSDNFMLPKELGKPCLLDDYGRTVFVKELEKKFNSPLTHPTTGMQLDYRRCMEHQVHHLASVIQGKISNYQPLVLK